MEEYKQIAAQMYGKDVDEFLATVSGDRGFGHSREWPGKVARESSIASASRNCGVFRRNTTNRKVYIDMYDHKHSYTPGVQIADQDTATVGAYHAADIVLLVRAIWMRSTRFRQTRTLDGLGPHACK